MKMIKEKLKRGFSQNGLLILLLLIMSVPLFSELGKDTIRMWDESRLAINAWEMYTRGDYLVTHYGGKPDMWNTKPPLMIWLQSLSMHIMGAGELAVRFPSAVAALLTLLLLITYAGRFFNRRTLFIIVSFILITSRGYVGHHVARTGDYDTLLVLFTTLFCLSFFMHLESNKNKYLYLTFLFLTLAVLTKSIAGLIFLPGLFLYALFTRKVRLILSNRNFYIGLACFLFIILGYYLWREIRNPGYFEAVIQNEVLGRYLEGMESHQFGILFYYYQLLVQFSAWFVLLPIGIFVGLLYPDARIRRFSLYLVVISCFFIAVISTAQTKLVWYGAPLLPFFAFFAALPLYLLYTYIPELLSFPKMLEGYKKYIPVVFLILVFSLPFKKILSSFEDTEEHRLNAAYYETSDYLKEALAENKQSLDYALLVYDAPTVAHVQFYINLLKSQDIQLSLSTWPARLEDYSSIIVAQPDYQTFIEKYYRYRLIEEWGTIKHYEILDRKAGELPPLPELKEDYGYIRIYDTPH